MIVRNIIIFFALFFTTNIAIAAPIDLNVRDIGVGNTGNYNDQLEEFVSPLSNFFYVPGWAGITDTFITIAFQIKNFFIAIAAIFLIIGVIRLLFSSNDEESIKKWKSNIIWTSVGIFIMQIAFSIWSTLILTNSSDRVGSALGWEFWVNVFWPIVDLLQILAAFGFILMAVWAFFIMATAGDEEKVKKSRNTILYAIIGFLLIKIPYEIIKAFYGRPGCEKSSSSLVSIGTCDIKEVDLAKWIGIIWKIFSFINTFLSVICVILIIYAGWLVLISWGDEEKLKKAKNIIIYIILGFILLVASHAIFRFFILKW